MQINGSGFTSIEQVTGQFLAPKSGKTVNQINEKSFLEILQEKKSAQNVTEELKFSKHADKRLADRNISLTQEQLQRLQEGAEAAGAKGIRESLVLMDDLAFIVNIKNNTVITAMSKHDENEKIFTNIDGAVMV